MLLSEITYQIVCDCEHPWAFCRCNISGNVRNNNDIFSMKSAGASVCDEKRDLPWSLSCRNCNSARRSGDRNARSGTSSRPKRRFGCKVEKRCSDVYKLFYELHIEILIQIFTSNIPLNNIFWKIDRSNNWFL